MTKSEYNKEDFIQNMCKALKIPRNFYDDETWNNLYIFTTELIKAEAKRGDDHDD